MGDKSLVTHTEQNKVESKTTVGKMTSILFRRRSSKKLGDKNQAKDIETEKIELSEKVSHLETNLEAEKDSVKRDSLNIIAKEQEKNQNLEQKLKSEKAERKKDANRYESNIANELQRNESL